jgi:CheY-like chemotaxis protein
MELGAKKVGLDPKIIKELTDVCINGQDALDLATRALVQSQTLYSLVLTDCSMPVMDGYNFSSELRKLYTHHRVRQPYIAACTGHTEDTYIEKAWKHQINEIIPKPANKEIVEQILIEVFMKNSNGVLQ